jgi:predicted nucleic acid-binding protein
MGESIIETAQATAKSLATNAPHLLVNLAIVVTFIWYLRERDASHVVEQEREDQVSVLRIGQCHDVQKEATKIMSSLAETMREHTKATREQSETFQDLSDLLRDQFGEGCFVY